MVFHQIGYLMYFFDLCTLETMKANVLSFAEVEDTREWKEEGTKKAIVAEVMQLLKDLRALKLVKWQEIPAEADLLSSYMLAVEKNPSRWRP